MNLKHKLTPYKATPRAIIIMNTFKTFQQISLKLLMRYITKIFQMFYTKAFRRMTYNETKITAYFPIQPRYHVSKLVANDACVVSLFAWRVLDFVLHGRQNRLA